MKTPLDLRSSWAKLLSARALRRALYELEPREKERPTVGVRFDEATGDHVVYISACPDYESLFLRTGLVFGHCLQDLRAALDHLVYALAYWHTNGNLRAPKDTQFPICEHPNDYKNGKAPQYLSEVHPLHVLAIDKLQPYNSLDGLWATGDLGNPLGVLRDLSNEDKHRLLHMAVLPTGVTVMTLGIDPWDEFVQLKRGITTNLVAEKGTELERIVRRSRLPDTDAIGYVGTMTRLEGPPHRSPWMVAREIEWTVSNILWLFQPLCNATPSTS